MTRREAALLTAALKAAYPRQEVDEATLAIYAESLLDLDYPAAQRTVHGLIRTSRFFPTIAEVRTAWAEHELGVPSAGAAWEQASNRWPVTNPVVRRALELVGGSYAIRTSENPVAIRAHFMRVYDDLRREAVNAVASHGAPALERAASGELAPLERWPGELEAEPAATEGDDDGAPLTEEQRAVLVANLKKITKSL